MNELEGVIKYKLKHRLKKLPDCDTIKNLNAWREILHRLKLINQLKDKYQGLGYGNISARLQPNTQSFIISGTQTGHLEKLNSDHYAIILSADTKNNMIKSEGLHQPSSEALTHASIYQASEDTQWIIHVHCPEIWQNTHALTLPYVPEHIPYGSHEMAEEVAIMLRTTTAKPPENIFSMLGHEDGIVSFGKTIDKAAFVLLKYLALALTIEQ